MLVKMLFEGFFVGELFCIDMLDDFIGDDNLGGFFGVGGVFVKGGRGRLEDLLREWLEWCIVWWFWCIVVNFLIRDIMFC